MHFEDETLFLQAGRQELRSRFREREIRWASEVTQELKSFEYLLTSVKKDSRFVRQYLKISQIDTV